MTQRVRVLSVGGKRAVLVGLARAFQKAGAVFAGAADPTRLIESAVRFEPHLILVFGYPSLQTAMQWVQSLRAEAKLGGVPIVLVCSPAPSEARGVTRVVPDPSEVDAFACSLLASLDELRAEAGEGGIDIDIVEEAPPPLTSRILLVDDDPALIKLFSVMMVRSGFEVLSAGDGLEGMQVALASRPDLIIADLNMPRQDGWGLLRSLRADHRVSETPVVFLSCHDDYRESLKAFQAGAQDYLPKDGKLEVLVSRVRDLLAPRDAFLVAVLARERAEAQVEKLGLQWALRKMAATRSTGVVEASDNFWKLRVGLVGGALVSAAAQIGPHSLYGPAAIPPLAQLRSGRLVYLPDAEVGPGNAGGDIAELLEEAAERNNAAEARALDRLMTQATRVEIDPALYKLYEQLGPPQSRPIAALVHQGLSPREVIARAECSPLDVEDTLRDLVRRRVVHLGN